MDTSVKSVLAEAVRLGLKPMRFDFPDTYAALICATPKQIREADERKVWLLKSAAVGKTQC